MTTAEPNRSSRLSRVGYWLLLIANVGLLAYVLPHWLSYENAEPITLALWAGAAALVVAITSNVVPPVAASAVGRRTLLALSLATLALSIAPIWWLLHQYPKNCPAGIPGWLGIDRCGGDSGYVSGGWTNYAPGASDLSLSQSANLAILLATVTLWWVVVWAAFVRKPAALPIRRHHVSPVGWAGVVATGLSLSATAFIIFMLSLVFQDDGPAPWINESSAFEIGVPIVAAGGLLLNMVGWVQLRRRGLRRGSLVTASTVASVLLVAWLALVISDGGIHWI